MKRGVGSFITGSAIMILLCVWAMPNVFAQPLYPGWPTLTLPLFKEKTGNDNPRIWNGVYRWKAKDNCRKWANGKKEKALVREELWMVLEYFDEEKDGNGRAPYVPYCYRAIFFSNEPSLDKFDPETFVGLGYLCPDWPPVLFSPDAPQETYLLDGFMCKNVEKIEDVGCDQLWIKLQARLRFPFKNREIVATAKVREKLKATPMEGWAVGLCGPYYNFFDATMDATPDNAFLKCRIKWKATWQKEIPDRWVSDAFRFFEELDDEDWEYRWPCDFGYYSPYGLGLGFKAFPMLSMPPP